MTEIGWHFELSNASTVSSAVQRIKERKTVDNEVSQQLEKLRAQIAKSQRRT
jgi:chromosomal replication initiation ATPase DnaA